MQDEKLLADSGSEGFIGTAAAADVDAQALDFLIERGERDHKTLGGLGLVPSGALKHIDDDAALDFVHDLEERRVGVVRAGAGARLPGQRRKKFGKLQPDAAHNFLAADVLREQIDVDALLRGKNYGALDNVFELAHIAGPVVIHKQLQRRGSKVAQGLVVFLAVADEEMGEQRRNIFAAITQGRQGQVNDVETMVQIFAEAAFANECEQLHVGRGDDADINLNLLGAPEAHEFALLNYAQKLGLRFRADGGDFVEEDGALIGDFKETFFGGNGAGERTFDVAEQLRLKEVHRNGAGVDGHECPVRACGGGMDGLGDEFLAGTALATD